MRFYQRPGSPGKPPIWWVKREDGRRHSLRSSDRREAERNFAEIVAAEREVRKPTITVAEIWARYVKSLAGRKGAARAEHAWKALEPVFGALVPARIQEEDCQRYLNERGRAAGTVHVELIFLRTALNYAADRGLIDRSYRVWVPPPAPPRDKRITKAQAARLLDACIMPHIRLFMVLAMNTAGRKEALLELTWDRVDFDRNHVQLSIPGRIGKGRATVPMNGTLRAALSEARDYALTDYVIEWGGQRVHEVAKGFNRAAAAAGLPWVTPHVLRHSSACWQIEAGVPLERIAQFLGHRDVATTYRIYARLSTHGMQNDADALELGTSRTLVRNRGTKTGTDGGKNGTGE